LGLVGLGVVLFLLAFINAVWAFLVRFRIPFAAAMLTVVCKTIEQYPATIYVALVGIVFQGAWFVCWALTIIALSDYGNVYWSQTQSNFVQFLLLISLYWTAEVINNIVHVTVAGTWATWYYLFPQQTPADPTKAAFFPRGDAFARFDLPRFAPLGRRQSDPRHRQQRTANQ